MDDYELDCPDNKYAAFGSTCFPVCSRDKMAVKINLHGLSCKNLTFYWS